MKTAVSMNDVKRGTVDHISARTEWQTIAKQLEKKRWISRGLFVLDRYEIATGKQIDRGKKKCTMKSIWKNCVFGFDLRHAASSTDLAKTCATHRRICWATKGPVKEMCGWIWWSISPSVCRLASLSHQWTLHNACKPNFSCLSRIR